MIGNKDLPSMASKDRQRLLAANCNHPSSDFLEFPMAEIGQSIPDRFEHIVSRYRDRLAVKTTVAEVTYGELNRAANCIARIILARRGRSNEPVALLLENDLPMIAAILGTLKAGKIYVPLDASLPKAELEYMLRDSQATMVLTDTANASLAGDLARDDVAWIDGQNLGRDLGAENLRLSISPGDYAWILYASGSTGRPKGIVQNHRNVLHYIRTYTNSLRLSAPDRLLLLFSFALDGAAHEMFSGLLNGASLHLFNMKREGLSKLPNWLMDQKLTIYSSTPTVFRNLCELLSEHQSLSSVRLVKLVGETVLKGDVHLYKKHFSSDCIFVNRFGSRETGTIRWFFMDQTTPIEGNTVPLGYPVADNDVVLLNEQDEEVPAGDVGEITVKSCYLSPGYWGEPDATEKVFLRDPDDSAKRIYRTGDLGRLLPDGCLLHLGRRNFRQIQGDRIEVGTDSR